jgi:hypothetical protein
VTSRILALAGLSAAMLAPAAAGASRGPSTTAPDVFVDIQVTITDSRIGLSRRTAHRGDEARFIIRNVGTKPHSFTLGTTVRGAGAQTGFSRTLKPKEQQVLLLFLNYRGRLPYRSKFPADRAKPGMRGVFKIL